MPHLKRTTPFRSRPTAAGWIGRILCAAIATTGSAKEIQLTDGTILAGEIGKTSGVAEDPLAPDGGSGAPRSTPIYVVEDGLRRTFLHKTDIRNVLEPRNVAQVRIQIFQNEADRGSSLGAVGPPSSVTPFDEWGRRVVELPSDKGAIAVVQGVTRITPVYTRVQGLRSEPRSYVWDMRLATSSLPRATLTRIFNRAVPRNDYDARLQVVRLYVQSERYRDAAEELKLVRADFAGRPDVDLSELDDYLRRLRDLSSNRLINEIELRREAGQFALSRNLLERFPADGVAGDTLQRVRELLDEDDARDARHTELLDDLTETAKGLTEQAAQRIAQRIVAEITARLSPASADRLAAFAEYSGGDALSAEELAAIAISGWLLGSEKAITSLPTALSLVRVRDVIKQYLTEPNPQIRDSLLIQLLESDAADVPTVAELLARMEPPFADELAAKPGADNEETPEPEAEPASTLPPGCHELFATAAGRKVRALVQLPPEYDPLRSYPTIVALSDFGVPAERMLEYWAGPVREGVGRLGQATRRGYVVLAVEWAAAEQLTYGYTAEEHAAVLSSLRHAMRRVAIDPDRVLLTGHGAGGDLAWDLALAHPDLWAGCLPYLAVAQRYCGFYWKNGKHVPWRIVMGELDGDKLKRNARELDRYLSPRFDARVVEYRGRGYDPLSDDVQRAFDWMGRKQRGAPPEEFEASTMRPWDNFFWWVEVDELPEKSMVAPAEWPRRGARAATITGRKYVGNKLGVNTAAKRVTVWLSPELVDFDEPLEVVHNGRRLTQRGALINPDLKVLLEDARTRADRKRPYWAKVESR